MVRSEVAAKALSLDRVWPDWKDAYFAPAVWLDDLLAEATGSGTLRDIVGE